MQVRKQWRRGLAVVVLPGLLASVAAPAAAQGDALPSAQSIITRYWEVIGGVEAVTAPQYRRTVGQMTLMGMTMSMNFIQARPNRMVMRGDIPGLGSIEQGYDGTHGWMVIPMAGARLLEGPELEQVQGQAQFDANLKFDDYPVMETVGRSEVDGQPCYQVRMVTPENAEALGCFSIADGYLIGINVTEPEPVVITFGDYRAYGALTLPSRTVITGGGQQMVLMVTNITHDPIDEAEFEPPAEVKALIDQR